MADNKSLKRPVYYSEGTYFEVERINLANGETTFEVWKRETGKGGIMTACFTTEEAAIANANLQQGKVATKREVILSPKAESSGHLKLISSNFEVVA